MLSLLYHPSWYVLMLMVMAVGEERDCRSWCYESEGSMDKAEWKERLVDTDVSCYCCVCHKPWYAMCCYMLIARLEWREKQNWHQHGWGQFQCVSYFWHGGGGSGCIYCSGGQWMSLSSMLLDVGCLSAFLFLTKELLWVLYCIFLFVLSCYVIVSGWHLIFVYSTPSGFNPICRLMVLLYLKQRLSLCR